MCIWTADTWGFLAVFLDIGHHGLKMFGGFGGKLLNNANGLAEEIHVQSH